VAAREFDASSIPELAARALSLAKETGPKPVVWYRGVSCDRHSLSPKLMRGSPRTMDEVNEREARLLTRFRQRSLPYWPQGYPQTPWEQMFAMQHHGLSTRLLDWSENLFLAAYFAAGSPGDNSTQHKELHQGSCVPCVWVLDPRGWNRAVPQLFDAEKGVLTTADEEMRAWEPIEMTDAVRLTGPARASWPVAIYGTHNSARISVQRGNFTVAGKDWKPLEGFCDEASKAATALSKIRLQSSGETLAELAVLGVGESAVYPDLAGLSRELEAMEGWHD